MLLLAVLLIQPRHADATAVYEVLDCANGIDVRLYSPGIILSEMTEKRSDGRLVMRLPDGVEITLVDDIYDPVISNRGDGLFHPMNVEWVVTALGEIDLCGRRMDIDVEIYVLPFPRYYNMVSSTCGGRIFLSPGVHEVSRETVAWTVTHEIGHAFHNRYLPDSDAAGWDRYLVVRGLDGEPAFSCYACHMNRPKEIFAEDFRYLFGCDESRVSGTLENPDIPLPDEVPGLAGFFITLAAPGVAVYTAPGNASVIAAANYPNPFNPSTTIRAEFDRPDQLGEVEINIYAVDGSLVKRLYRGRPSSGEVTAVWDGTTAWGATARSGVYFFRVKSGRHVRSGKMLLIR